MSDINDWLTQTIRHENKTLGAINIILCSDEHLLKINIQHLEHDYYTDIITFDYSEGRTISGDLFISIDRINENAKLYSVDSITELHRVMVHGILHLCGYNDKSHDEQKEMRSKEDHYLSLRSFTK